MPSRYWQGHGYLSRTGQSLTPSPRLIAYTPRRGSNPARRKDIVADRRWRGQRQSRSTQSLHICRSGVSAARRGRAREVLTRVIHEDRYRVKRQPMVYTISTHMPIGYHGQLGNNGQLRNNSTFCISQFCPNPKHMFAKSAKTTRSTSGNLDQWYMPTPIPDRVKTGFIRQSKTFYQLNPLVDRCFWRFFA